MQEKKEKNQTNRIGTVFLFKQDKDSVVFTFINFALLGKVVEIPIKLILD